MQKVLMPIKGKYIFCVALILACLFAVSTAFAAPPPSFSDSMGRFNTFMGNVKMIFCAVKKGPSFLPVELFFSVFVANIVKTHPFPFHIHI